MFPDIFFKDIILESFVSEIVASFLQIGYTKKLEEAQSMPQHRTVTFTLNGSLFEYDEDKNEANIKKHGISFRTAARVFFDYDRIELYDEENSYEEDRYNVIGDTSAGIPLTGETILLGGLDHIAGVAEQIIYVVYTERRTIHVNESEQTITRIISARLATSFERGLYYGKQR